MCVANELPLGRLRPRAFTGRLSEPIRPGLYEAAELEVSPRKCGVATAVSQEALPGRPSTGKTRVESTGSIIDCPNHRAKFLIMVTIFVTCNNTLNQDDCEEWIQLDISSSETSYTVLLTK